MSIWQHRPRRRAIQIGAPIVLDSCVIDLIAAEVDGRSPPQLLVLMTAAAMVDGHVHFPIIPAELERRFKAVAAELREQAGDAL